jgi:hypothetical protein
VVASCWPKKFDRSKTFDKNLDNGTATYADAISVPYQIDPALILSNLKISRDEDVRIAATCFTTFEPVHWKSSNTSQMIDIM